MYSKRFVQQLHSAWLVCLLGMLVAGTQPCGVVRHF